MLGAHRAARGGLRVQYGRTRSPALAHSHASASARLLSGSRAAAACRGPAPRLPAPDFWTTIQQNPLQLRPRVPAAGTSCGPSTDACWTRRRPGTRPSPPTRARCSRWAPDRGAVRRRPCRQRPAACMPESCTCACVRMRSPLPPARTNVSTRGTPCAGRRRPRGAAARARAVEGAPRGGGPQVPGGVAGAGRCRGARACVAWWRACVMRFRLRAAKRLPRACAHVCVCVCGLVCMCAHVMR